MSEQWYEVWADETLSIPYLLLLKPTESGFAILDPKKGDGPVFESATYEEAKTWLLEDEFVKVGRKEIDD